ncbi:conserved hypothetical protein [Ricinus communis]|uniref:Uncharacterized protein n=1 Tax=Ricinus communis TaxID=3988 RepID=B9SG14_RICCO|nr:conserved hypothetical protein [Ricinus communis]
MVYTSAEVETRSLTSFEDLESEVASIDVEARLVVASWAVFCWPVDGDGKGLLPLARVVFVERIKTKNTIRAKEKRLIVVGVGGGMSLLLDSI